MGSSDPIFFALERPYIRHDRIGRDRLIKRDRIGRATVGRIVNMLIKKFL
jgi:hypothetical protein